MGVGRRMGKKQGPPTPLDESIFRKGRKQTSRDADSNVPQRGKKRKANGELKQDAASTSKPARAKANGVNGAFKQSQKSTSSKKPATTKTLKQADEEDDDDGGPLTAEFPDLDNGDIDDDLLVDSDEGSLPDGGDEMRDDFLDSGSSIYDSDAQEGGGMFSDDDDSDAEEKLTAANIEGLSRRLEQAQEDDARQAQLELEEAALQTNLEDDRPKVLADGSDAEDDTATSRLAPDLQVLRSRITDTVRILDDFSKLCEPGHSRAEYTSQLIKDICLYYGYSSYLAEKLFDLFPPREAFAFFEANETARPLVIRTNTLKTNRRELAQGLINRGVTLEPVGKWSKVGLQIFDSQVPLGATPEYLAGHYILQAASSFLPVMALAPQEGERILDMAAAPGGKTTYMAAGMRNTGSIFANDSNKSRAKGLIGNIHRLGVKNTIVCSYDAREFPKVIGGFDRVLLDAPCSGTGVIAKDASVKTNKTEKDFMQMPHLQKQLLLAAIDSVDHASKTGGYIVYSTCSVTVEENEQVVQYALSKRPNVKLVETGLTFGVNGFVRYQSKQFDAKMNLTKRYYPHKYNVDGFFVSKFQKTGPTVQQGREVNGQGPANALATDVTSTIQSVPGDDDAENEESVSHEQDGFGGWEEQEDAVYIDRARRRLLKKRGIDPRGVKPSHISINRGDR